MSLTRFLRKHMNDPSQLSLLLDVCPSDDVNASPTASTTSATQIETANPQSVPLVSEQKIEHPHHLSEAHRAVTPKVGTRRIMLDQTALD